MVVFIIPAAFHYRGVSVHVDNQTVWGSSASVSVSHRHPWFVPACSAMIPVCCCCQRLGTAAAPPPLPSELSPINTCQNLKDFTSRFLAFPPDFQNYSPWSFKIPVRGFQLPVVRCLFHIITDLSSLSLQGPYLSLYVNFQAFSGIYIFIKGYKTILE